MLKSRICPLILNALWLVGFNLSIVQDVSKLTITDGTKCSWVLRVAFLENPNAAVAGCGLCRPHRNPN